MKLISFFLLIFSFSSKNLIDSQPDRQVKYIQGTYAPLGEAKGWGKSKSVKISDGYSSAQGAYNFFCDMEKSIICSLDGGKLLITLLTSEDKIEFKRTADARTGYTIQFFISNDLNQTKASTSEYFPAYVLPVKTRSFDGTLGFLGGISFTMIALGSFVFCSKKISSFRREKNKQINEINKKLEFLSKNQKLNQETKKLDQKNQDANDDEKSESISISDLNKTAKGPPNKDASLKEKKIVKADLKKVYLTDKNPKVKPLKSGSSEYDLYQGNIETNMDGLWTDSSVTESPKKWQV